MTTETTMTTCGAQTDHEALGPAPAWLVEGAGPDDVWDAEDAEDAATQAARAQWGDDVSVEWVGPGPTHAHSEWAVRWTSWVGGEPVAERARVVVSRVRPTLPTASAVAS